MSSQPIFINGKYPLVSAGELNIGDKILLHDGDYPSVAIIKNIQEKEGRKYLTIFSPYPHRADFIHVGGVICYTGTQEWEGEADSIDGAFQIYLLEKFKK